MIERHRIRRSCIGAQRVRLIEQRLLAEEVERLLVHLREYRRGWLDDAGVRAERRMAVEPDLQRVDCLWSALERSPAWVSGDALQAARSPRATSLG